MTGRPQAPGADGRAADLRIASLVPLSTVDWPGMLAATLFLQGCPWRCTYCHNEAILDPTAPGKVLWSDVQRLLDRRTGLLDAVVFSGGEATLQRALVPAAREVKARGFRVGLHTGGAYPARLRALVGDGCAEERLVDWVGFDLKAPPALYPEVVRAGGPVWEKVRESFQVLAAAGVDMQVRMTITPTLGPFVTTVLDTLASLRREQDGTSGADGDRFPARLVLQQARADGAPAAFAHALPVAKAWDWEFARIVKVASAHGEQIGVGVRHGGEGGLTG